MKRFIPLIIVVLIFVVVLAVSVRPLILRAAQKQLSKVFIDGAVSIEAVQFLPLRRIILLNIEIRRAEDYDLKIAQISVDYSIPSLLKKTIEKVTVKDVRLDVTLPQKNMAALSLYVNQGPKGKFTVKEITLADLSLGLHLKNIALEARASAVFSPADLSVRSLDLTILSLEIQKFLLQDGALSLNPGAGPNELYVKNVQYDKAKAEELHGRVRMEGNDLFVDDLSARAFNGEIKGHADLRVGPPVQYRASLDFIDLDLARFVEAFELKEKFLMSGLIGGRIVLSGTGTDMEILNGELAITKAGGTLTIQDPRLLENIAKSSGQSLDILVESFKNYYYNTGTVTLSLDENNLLLSMALDGEVGKRDLNIVLHNFQLRKDGL